MTLLLTRRLLKWVITYFTGSICIGKISSMRSKNDIDYVFVIKQKFQ